MSLQPSPMLSLHPSFRIIQVIHASVLFLSSKWCAFIRFRLVQIIAAIICGLSFQRLTQNIQVKLFSCVYVYMCEALHNYHNKALVLCHAKQRMPQDKGLSEAEAKTITMTHWLNIMQSSNQRVASSFWTRQEDNTLKHKDNDRPKYTTLTSDHPQRN